MSTFEIVAELKPMATVEELTSIVGRPPDDTRRPDGLMWLARDIGEANRLFELMNGLKGLVSRVSRYKRRAGVAKGQR